jgi:YVTN family beta-propeller protein
MAVPPRRLGRFLTACLGLFLALAGASPVFSFSLNGYRWPDGAQIVLHLQLTHLTDGLQDGSASWNDSAADALNVWNQFADTVQFVAAEPLSSSGNDGASEVLFSSTVYGDSWPANVLAVTLKISSQGNLFTETDVLFNDNLKWDSYRGPLQLVGPSGPFDFHRVALHEFGHVLGLDHPDTHGQTVTAQMNSVIGDLDQLTDDDIAGARSIYGFRVTSNLKPNPVEIGTSFSYQITANNQPLGYGVSGLPAGLQLNSATGLITGTPTETGTFSVLLTVHGSRRDVIATLVIQITPRRITSGLSGGVDIGGTFSYYITADNSPTSFNAIGLPSGLQLNTRTGQITGIPDLSGTYMITVIAHGSFGDAMDVLRLVVNALPAPTPLLATLPVTSYSGPIVADPARPYIYVASYYSVTVIDAGTLTVKTTVPISGFVGDMAISADGNRLWLAYDPSNGADYKIRSLELNTFSLLPDVPVAVQPARIREGLNGRLYVSDLTGKVWMIDSASGATQGQVGSYRYTPGLAISLDRTVLFVGAERDFPAAILKYDVSGSTPRLLQSADAGNYGWHLRLSNTGKYVCLTTNPTSSPDGTREFSASDLTKNFGTLQMDSPISVGFSPDDTVAYQTSQHGSYVGVYDTASAQLLRKIELGNNAAASDVAVDRSGSYVFVVGAAIYGSAWVRVYPASNSAPRLTGPPHSLLNISTRLRTQAADNALIGGLIVNGTEPKKVALRAMGPSLPVAGKLTDPLLELYDSSGARVAQNDNWNTHRADLLAAGIPPLDEHEAALVTSVAPGNYTAVVRGIGDGSGVALVEAYDLSPESKSKLANISTRGKVESGDNVMIGGFIIGGDQTTEVVVRAVGPSLGTHGVAGALLDPTLEVHDGNGVLVAQDDDWRMYQEQPLIQTGLAPADDREAAMILFLQPGAYTAVVRGKNDSTGIGLVEVYNLDAN